MQQVYLCGKLVARNNRNCCGNAQCAKNAVSKSHRKNRAENFSRTSRKSLPLDIIRKVFEQSDDEWMAMTAFGSTWKRLQVDFDPRNYGCKKFTDLVKKYTDIFDYDMRKTAEDTQERMYVRLKV